MAKVESPQSPGGVAGMESIEEIEPSVDLSDEDLIRLSEKWMEESTSFHDELKKVQDQNDRYYQGDQTARDEIPSHQCNAVDNRIFMGIETIVPMVTANTPQFVVLPAQNNEKSQRKANALQEILKIIYESRDVAVKEKLKQAVRNMLLYRFGVLKIYWDEDIDDVNIKSVRPQRIWLPQYGQTEDELPFIIEKVDMDYDEIKEIFGREKLEQLRTIVGQSDDEENPELSRVATVWECWTNEFVFWRCGSVILGKKSNPYFDFAGRQETTIDEGGNAVVEDLFHNHFRKPRKPYVILSAYRLGHSIVGDTDLVQQVISQQDVVNALGRQIVNNANKMGNAAWMVDAEVMEQERAKTEITNEPGLVIWGAGVANESMIRRDTPPPLPNYIINAKLAAENAIDNLLGTHATTRGERRQPETLGGRMLLKQADIQRGGTFVDEIDRAVAEVGNWFTQLLRLYYDKERTIRIYGDVGIEFMRFVREDIEDGINVIVKEGSTLQQDEMAKRNEALILWQNGALDPITLFERLKFPNPSETAQRLIDYKMGKLMPAQGGIPPEGIGGGKGAQPSVNPQEEMREAQGSVTGGIAGGEF